MYDLSCVVGTEGSKNDCLHTEDAENSVADQARKLDNLAAPSDAAGLEDFQRAIDFQFMLGSLGSCSLILVDVLVAVAHSPIRNRVMQNLSDLNCICQTIWLLSIQTSLSFYHCLRNGWTLDVEQYLPHSFLKD